MIKNRQLSHLKALSSAVFFIMLSAAAQAGAEQNPATQSPSPAGSGLILDQPLTLDQALDLALARNPDMHIANERIARAEAQIGKAWRPSIRN